MFNYFTCKISKCVLLFLEQRFQFHLCIFPLLPASGHQGPAWLPAAFQHVSYLVAPPKTKAQLEQEQADRDFNGIREDPMVNVDMTPWYLAKTKKHKTDLFFPNGWVEDLQI